MKKILDSLTGFFASLAAARTASSLARLGHTEKSLAVIQSTKDK